MVPQRHPELVSQIQSGDPRDARNWTLKQVQGDGWRVDAERLDRGHGRDHPPRSLDSAPLGRGRAPDFSRGSSPTTSPCSRRSVRSGRVCSRPQGKALFDFILWADGADVLVDCETEAAGELARRLGLYRLRRKIAIDPVEALAVHWAKDGEGPRDPRLPELGRRWLAPPGRRRGGLARPPALAGRHRGTGRAGLRQDALARMQCRRAERGQLHQGLLCRPGEYGADELPLEGQSAAGRRSGRCAGRARPGSTIPSWAWRSSIAASRISARRSCPDG